MRWKFQNFQGPKLVKWFISQKTEVFLREDNLPTPLSHLTHMHPGWQLSFCQSLDFSVAPRALWSRHSAFSETGGGRRDSGTPSFRSGFPEWHQVYVSASQGSLGSFDSFHGTKTVVCADVHSEPSCVTFVIYVSNISTGHTCLKIEAGKKKKLKKN